MDRKIIKIRNGEEFIPIQVLRGNDGKSAYESAVEGGYSDTEDQFYTDLADVSSKYSPDNPPPAPIASVISIADGEEKFISSNVEDALQELATTKQNVPNVITSGESITLEDNTVYRLSNVSTLDISYPDGGNFESLIILTTAESGDITITFPTSSYIGEVPFFSNSESWEISIRDGVIIAGKVV